MDRRTKIIIVIIIILLILLALLLFWFRFRGQEPEVVFVAPEEDVTAVVEETGPIEMVPVEEVIKAPSEVSVDTVAKTFAERYASYSNESDFANLRDLEPLMTQVFYEQTERFIAITELDPIYQGITSQVLSTQVVLNGDETAAEVTLTMQREKALGSPQNTEVTYETLVLDMVKESGSWKVNGATWE